MRLLIQECRQGSVTIDGKEISRIERGEVVFVGFTAGDDEVIIGKMVEKLLKLRIFADANGKTNLSLDAIHGNILAVSQFTLYADLTQGNRPSFLNALAGPHAVTLYDSFCAKLKEKVPLCQFGIFGADMKVNLINDGPFTILLDSKELF